jgi:ABC-type amino acid transport substrate-binding protein
MKTLKIITSAFLFTICLVSFSQSATTSTSVKTNVYYVQSTHTPEQCLKTLDDMKGKGDAFLSKFEFGCMSGDHTAYAFLAGTSEADVRQMLPKDLQANAKIQKVDKFTPDQIEKLHKGKTDAGVKK